MQVVQQHHPCNKHTHQRYKKLLQVQAAVNSAHHFRLYVEQLQEDAHNCSKPPIKCPYLLLRLLVMLPMLLQSLLLLLLLLLPCMQ
jgi:hypothetical protein